MNGMFARLLAPVAFAAFNIGSAVAQPSLPHADVERIEARIQALADFGRNADGGVSRVAYSDADIAGRQYVSALMKNAGLSIRIDAGGNIIARRNGLDSELSPIMFGSHTDSVPHGGNYDGNVGVIGAIEVIELLNQAQITTQHPLEVVIFSNEEGGLVGSQVMTTGIDQAQQAELSHSGFTISEGIRRIGGDPAKAQEPSLKPGDLTAFLELHIEQGATLDIADVDIGIVEGIVGIRWWDIKIEGVANHAGTTPMHLRRDALVAAADLILTVNLAAKSMKGAQVATVGRISSHPGAFNVIPGQVEMSLEIRDLADPRILAVFKTIRDSASQIEKTRDVKIEFSEVPIDARPAPTHPRVRNVIESAAAELGHSYLRMPSGAGHDAQEMVSIAPTGMIFVPSVNGISHSPDEYTTAEDIANGTDTLLITILRIDRGQQ